MSDLSRAFYEREYRGEGYSNIRDAEWHPFFPMLQAFIERYDLQDKKCLEVGCGRGAFQDVVQDFSGVDISSAAGRHLHKPFSQASATHLPFEGDSFDAAWSYAVLEHVPGPEKALAEMRRVIKPNGYLLLAPAWQCRPWAAEGFAVRPYTDFDWHGKLVKASIPLRNSVALRALSIFPRRALRTASYLFSRNATEFNYRELDANFEHYWMSDSDAVNSMDPYEAILWFVSRGDICLSHPKWRSKFYVRTGALAFKLCS